MIVAPLTLMLVQVGPDPIGVELEPLPIPRSARESGTGDDSTAVRDMVDAAVAAAIKGNEAILAGDYAAAVTHFEHAQVQALAAGRNALAAEIGIDRARALGLLERWDEAAAILSEVRLRRPDNAEGWRTSALAARHLDRLGEAQEFIQRAAELAPTDPAVGLEAGAIAYYAGDLAAAHRSWQSVIALAPESDEAAIATDYIARTADTAQQEAP